jgi:hypothetical protein
MCVFGDEACNAVGIKGFDFRRVPELSCAGEIVLGQHVLRCRGESRLMGRLLTAGSRVRVLLREPDVPLRTGIAHHRFKSSARAGRGPPPPASAGRVQPAASVAASARQADHRQAGHDMAERDHTASGDG